MIHTRLFLIFLAVSTLLFSACGGDAASEASLANVRAHLPKEPRRLFPLVAANAYEGQVNDLIYQNLLQFDPLTEQLAPELASELPAIQTLIEGPHAGATGYTFTLRPQASWSDGKPLTVRDVLFSFKAIWFPGFASSPLRGAIRELVDIEVDPADSSKFTIIASTANLNGAAYYGNIPILPEHIFDPNKALRSVSLPTLLATESTEALPAELKDFASEERTAPFGKTIIVGSGAYTFDTWKEGEFIRLLKNPSYWAKDLDEGLFLAGPDTIEFIPVPDQTAALAMLRNGDLDVLANIPPQEAIDIRDNEPEIHLFTPPQYTRTFIYINEKDPKLADKNTRRGLAHLLDVEGFLRDVQLGFGLPLNGPYDPSQAYAKTAEHPVAYSLDSAAAAFRRAGWSDSNADGILDMVINGNRIDLEVEYLYPSISSSSEALALLYSADAAKAGVKIVPVGKEYGALLGDLNQRNFQLVQGAIGGEPLPEDPFGLWHTESDSPGGKNRSGFGNATSDALIDSIRVNLDEASRNEQYERFANIIADDQPVIFLIVPQERIGIRKGLKPVITSRRPGYYLPGFTAAKPLFGASEEKN